jgi:hypothetical protein
VQAALFSDGLLDVGLTVFVAGFWVVMVLLVFFQYVWLGFGCVDVHWILLFPLFRLFNEFFS